MHAEPNTLDENAAARPYFPKTRSPAHSVGYCVSSGGVFGLLAWAACREFYQLVGFPGLAFAWFIGVMVGFCCSAVAVPLLNSRDLTRAKPIVMWPTGLAILAMFGSWGVPALVAAPLPFLVFLCVARAVLPRVSNDHDSCAQCGYNIRASREFGRCPECGTAIVAARNPFASAMEGEIRSGSSPVRRVELFLLRHPSVPLLMIFLAIVGPLFFLTARRAMRKAEFLQSIRSVGPNGTIDLSTSAPFPWDYLLIFGSYDAVTAPPGVDAGSWQRMLNQQTSIIPVDEGEVLIVFVRGNCVVEHLKFGRNFEVGELSRVSIGRDQATFRVTQPASPNQFTLVPHTPTVP